MKSRHYLSIAIAGSVFAASCGNDSTKTTTSQTDTVKTAVPMPAVALADVSQSPDFPNAKLAVKTVKAEKAGNDSAKVTFSFDVKDYELKLQTSDNGSKMCNNSDKGQHIHFILDNSPYKALYEPVNEVTVANNSEHYLVAFLSRSYHESVKGKDAAIVYHFKIDEKGNLKKLEEPKSPMLVYSRPKGEYAGKDTTNILLDFYVLNCTLGADGYKVKADINNMDRPSQQLSTTLSKWSPHFIQNLGTGKCKVSLTLVDKDGKNAEGPQVAVSREFTLKAQ